MAKGRGKNAPDRAKIVKQPAQLAPDPPEDLPPDGANMWREVVGALQEDNYLQRIDLPLVHSYCFAWQVLKSAERLMYDKANPNDFAIIQASPSGGTKASSIWTVWRQAQDQLLRIAKELGFSPLARAHIKITNAAADSLGFDLFDRFMARAAKEAQSGAK
jgi:P27 family predicted phage terminase small subunit